MITDCMSICLLSMFVICYISICYVEVETTTLCCQSTDRGNPIIRLWAGAFQLGGCRLGVIKPQGCGPVVYWFMIINTKLMDFFKIYTNSPYRKF